MWADGREGKDNEGRESLAAELKEKRGATLLRDLHSCSSPSPSRDTCLDIPGGSSSYGGSRPCVGRHRFGFGFTPKRSCFRQKL